MMHQMIRSILMAMLSLAVFAAPASAQDDEEQWPDARFEHYAKPVALDDGGTAGTWILFVILAVLGTAGLFKNARRTHLD